MFPFSRDAAKYTSIALYQASNTLASNYPRGILYEVELSALPDSLRKTPTLKQAFVSGVQGVVTAIPAGGQANTIIFTVREDIKDAPETGNMNAYLLLSTGEQVLMSPPCHKLGPFPHHFSGPVPLSAAFKPSTPSGS